MKSTSRDQHVLESLRPLELAAYLRSTGWSHERPSQDQWAVWTKGDEYEIALPMSRDLGDFVLRMGDVIKTLEVVESRSQIEILNDLSTSLADVLRFRIEDPTVTDGTIPIEEGAQIVQRARDLMMAGACAAIEKRAVYETRKPNKAIEYLKKVRLGQTERGSFVLIVLSSVPPEFRPGDGNELFEIEEPFERKVTTTLAKSIAAMKRASSHAATASDFAQFKDAVQIGVSANLCDAISGFAPSGHADRSVEISFSWSRYRPIGSENVENRVVFTPDSIPLIEEAARVFRETTPRNDFELRGPVVKLERDSDAEKGRVTVFGFVEEQPRKVVLELESPDYSTAIQAHKNHQTVHCEGSLVKHGRGYMLSNPRDIRIESDE